MEFLTPDEKAQLEQKLQERIDQRPVISKRIAEARALGDLKENADYHAARDDQGLNEAEIRRIEERLKKAAVVKDDEDIPKDIVFLGSSVKLKDVESGAEEQYKRFVQLRLRRDRGHLQQPDGRGADEGPDRRRGEGRPAKGHPAV